MSECNQWARKHFRESVPMYHYVSQRSRWALVCPFFTQWQLQSTIMAHLSLQRKVSFHPRDQGLRARAIRLSIYLVHYPRATYKGTYRIQSCTPIL